MDHIETLKQLASSALELDYRDTENRDALLHRVEMYFRMLAADSPHYVRSLKSIEFMPGVYPCPEEHKRSRWSQGCNALSSLILALAEQIESFGVVPESTPDPVRRLERVCERFHQVVRQLGRRYGDRAVLSVADEYDVQDLIHALLRIDFDDIRSEEYVPSYAGGATRMDFLLKPEQIVIEVKHTRSGLRDRQVGDQLIEDIQRYAAHQDCRTLVCFVYDPDSWIQNPRGLEHDLTRQDGPFPVHVWVRP